MPMLFDTQTGPNFRNPIMGPASFRRHMAMAKVGPTSLPSGLGNAALQFRREYKNGSGTGGDFFMKGAYSSKNRTKNQGLRGTSMQGLFEEK